VTALRSFVDPSGNTVVLFGAGGTAHAVELAARGREPHCRGEPQPPRAEPLVALLKEKTKAKSELVVWPHSFRVPEGADIVINRHRR
jgi:shikimate 5-dehydrogenase